MSHHSLHTAIRTEISRQLTTALKGRDRVAITALRAALGALDQATAVPLDGTSSPSFGATADVPRRELTRADIETQLLAEAEKHSAAAAEYEGLGHSDHAERLRHEAAIIRSTLEHLAAIDTPAAP